jgi:hypothetical protein
VIAQPPFALSPSTLLRTGLSKGGLAAGVKSERGASTSLEATKEKATLLNRPFGGSKKGGAAGSSLRDLLALATVL